MMLIILYLQLINILRFCSEKEDRLWIKHTTTLKEIGVKIGKKQKQGAQHQLLRQNVVVVNLKGGDKFLHNIRQGIISTVNMCRLNWFRLSNYGAKSKYYG